MQFVETVKDGLMHLSDRLFEALPMRRPSPELFRDLKVIAHRGSVTASTKENTMAAFELADRTGVWGIEFDLRFTSDGRAVIHHDKHTQRVFGRKSVIADRSLAELKQRHAELATLEEVVDRFGGRRHLMIEIKTMLTPAHADAVRSTLARLEPVRDYHIISLNPDRFSRMTHWAREAFLPIAEFNGPALSRRSLAESWGGLMGQYLLLSSRTMKRHQDRGQKIGTGFANTPAVLFREMNRGVDFIFTDKAALVLAACQEPSGHQQEAVVTPAGT